MKKFMQIAFVLLCLFFLGCLTANVFVIRDIVEDEFTRSLIQILFYSSSGALGLFCVGVAIKSHFDKKRK